MRRIGALMLYAENDPVGQSRSVVFRQELEKLGWMLGRNLMIDFHWGVGDDDWTRAAVAQLLARTPDLILANGSATVRPMQQATRTVPIIFIGGGGDPVAEGFVQSLAHPGGNLTGFTVLEPSIGAKTAGAAQGDRAARQPRHHHAQSRQHLLPAPCCFGGGSRAEVRGGGGHHAGTGASEDRNRVGDARR